MVLRLVSGGSITELSVTDSYRDADGDQATLQPFDGLPLVNIDHFEKVNESGA